MDERTAAQIASNLALLVGELGRIRAELQLLREAIRKNE